MNSKCRQPRTSYHISKDFLSTCRPQPPLALTRSLEDTHCKVKVALTCTLNKGRQVSLRFKDTGRGPQAKSWYSSMCAGYPLHRCSGTGNYNAPQTGSSIEPPLRARSNRCALQHPHSTRLHLFVSRPSGACGEIGSLAKFCFWSDSFVTAGWVGQKKMD